jgi:hypothetical protein
MSKLNRNFSKEVQMTKKCLIIFDIFNHEGNRNQNDMEIASHHTQNGFIKNLFVQTNNMHYA